MHWENLASEHGGVMPIGFTGTVTLDNGKLTFDAELDNKSDCFVEAVDYPYFGDFNPPSRQSSLTSCTMKNGRMSDMAQEELYPHFVNRKGYWGVFYPTKVMDDYHSMFCLLQSPDQGLSVRVDAPKAPYRLEYTFEQHPGIVSSITQLVPPVDEIPGKDALWGTDENAENSMTPVFLIFRTCHFVFAPPTSTTHLTPVVLRCYSGDTQAGKELYKQSQEQSN